MSCSWRFIAHLSSKKSQTVKNYTLHLEESHTKLCRNIYRSTAEKKKTKSDWRYRRKILFLCPSKICFEKSCYEHVYFYTLNTLMLIILRDAFKNLEWDLAHNNPILIRSTFRLSFLQVPYSHLQCNTLWSVLWLRESLISIKGFFSESTSYCKALLSCWNFHCDSLKP